MRSMLRSLLHRVFRILLITMLAVTSGAAQQHKMSEAARKKEKVERSYKKAYAKARKRTIKHRREIQTDVTKERMDAADRRASTYNKQNDPTLIERYFKRKRPRKR